jgi:RNA polymerase sigma-70 factor (ECF subfamily)
MADADERFLVEAAQRDPSRFADLYDRHFERVYAFIVRRVRNRDAAEELTAEVFHKALAHLPTFEVRGAPFGAWLIRIAANAVIDRTKRDGREVVDSDSLPDTILLPAVDLDRDEQCARLFRLVDALPDVQRDVIVDRFVDERSLKETAERLGRTEGAVKQLQYRALETLRRQMRDPKRRVRMRVPVEDGSA